MRQYLRPPDPDPRRSHVWNSGRESLEVDACCSTLSESLVVLGRALDCSDFSTFEEMLEKLALSEREESGDGCSFFGLPIAEESSLSRKASL